MTEDTSHRSLDELKEAVTEVETLLQAIKAILKGIESDAEHDHEAAYPQIESLVDQYRVLQQTFLHWESLEELDHVQRSEIVRALDLLKRVSLISDNALRLTKKALGIPDPEREQAEIEMHLRQMSAIHQQFDS